MTVRARTAGGPRALRTGILAPVALLLGIGAGSGGCEPPAPPLSDPELRQELGISDAAAIHRIRVTGSGDRTRLLPLRTQIRPGDVVQFVILDNRTHLVRFLDDETASDALEFLRHTGQDRPPPLVARESRLVLSFRDAPPGRYPFRVESTGSPVEGEIRVR